MIRLRSSTSQTRVHEFSRHSQYPANKNEKKVFNAVSIERVHTNITGWPPSGSIEIPRVSPVIYLCFVDAKIYSIITLVIIIKVSTSKLKPELKFKNNPLFPCVVQISCVFLNSL